jgi:hypothetical protein
MHQPRVKIVCSTCRTEKSVRGVPCAACGSRGESQQFEIGLAGEVDTAGAIGLVQASWSPTTACYRLRVRTPAGTESDARLENNTITLSVSEASEIGRTGESNALGTLLDAMRREGLTLVSGLADDARGEDARVKVVSVPYVVQFVTVPSDPVFWREAATGSSQTGVSTDGGIGWIRDAIVAKSQKTPPAERQHTLLALDARHAGILAAKEVSTKYVAQYADPRVEFGFASTWLVGPTTSASTQLGTSAWQQ